MSISNISDDEQTAACPCSCSWAEAGHRAVEPLKAARGFGALNRRPTFLPAAKVLTSYRSSGAAAV